MPAVVSGASRFTGGHDTLSDMAVAHIQAAEADTLLAEVCAVADTHLVAGHTAAGHNLAAEDSLAGVDSFLADTDLEVELHIGLEVEHRTDLEGGRRTGLEGGRRIDQEEE